MSGQVTGLLHSGDDGARTKDNNRDLEILFPILACMELEYREQGLLVIQIESKAGPLRRSGPNGRQASQIRVPHLCPTHRHLRVVLSGL